ncbi:MAG: heavy metal translocating P-type ATPase [Gaiellaceae bacterium]
MSATATIEIPLGLEEDCADCAERMQDGLRRHRGIELVEAAGSGSALLVRYDPDLCSLACVSEEAGRLRVDLTSTFEHAVLNVSGMDCYDCAQTIERAVCRMPGVTGASVNFPAARMRVEYDGSAVELDRVAAKVRGLGYGITRVGGAAEDEQAPTPWWRRREASTGIAAVLLLLALIADFATSLGILPIALYAAAGLVGGWPVARSGANALLATRRPDINFLMTIAVIGAAFIGAWLEAALVVVLFSIGVALEGRAVERARRELAGLVALAPEFARVRRGGAEVELPVAELVVGDLVVVRPGERIPADGAVVEGASAVDEAPITGESTPVDKEAGDPLFAGTLNGQGLLVLRVGAAPGDTTIAKIGRLVEEAQARKSPSERWVDAFAKVYTPIVIGAAALVATVPLAFGVEFSTALYSALALLILACPCALVISTPVSIVSALGRASAAGVLVKGGAHLERAALVTTVAFDKTGTLTEGKPQLAAVEPFGTPEEELLSLAASLERGSEHPLAKAIVAAAVSRGVALDDVSDFEALTGLGARGRVGGAEIAVGSPRFFGELDGRAAAAVEGLQARGQTAVIVTRDGVAVGALGLADRPRPEAAEAVAALGRLGISRTILLTGDNRATAEAIAREVGVSEVRAELMPEDKATAIAELGPGAAMVGDGVNDAPALASAELGFAMGSAGSDTAIEVADIALMGDDPRKVAGLIGLARWTRSIVRQNIAFSLGTKAVALAFLAAGALPLWAAVGTDVGASLIVVANGLRLLRRAPAGRLRGAPILLPVPRRAAAPAAADSACC